MKQLLIGLLASIALTCAVARADTTGSLVGTVSDDRGAPVAGATVTIESPAESFVTMTDTDGRYSFFNLIPGAHRLTVTKNEYASVALEDVPIAPGCHSRVRIYAARTLIANSATQNQSHASFPDFCGYLVGSGYPTTAFELQANSDSH